MTDEEKALESAQEPQEPQEAPLPEVPSGVSGDQPISAPALDTDTLVDAVVAKLSPVLEEKISRTVQSTKDKRFSDLEKIKKLLDETGGNVSEASFRMQVDEIQEKLSSEPQAGTGGWSESDTAFAQAQSAQLLQGAGIDFEDPEYKLLVAQYGGAISNPNQWVQVVQTFVDQKATKVAKQDVTPAAAAGEPSRAAKPVDDSSLEELNQQLQDLMMQPASTEIMLKRKELRQKIAGHIDSLQGISYRVGD